jgi:hypothetical protein
VPSRLVGVAVSSLLAWAASSRLAPYTPGHSICAVVQGLCLYAWVEAEKQLLLAPPVMVTLLLAAGVSAIEASRGD